MNPLLFRPLITFSLFALVALFAFNSSFASTDQLSWPLEGAVLRLTPLHFGMYVTPDSKTNPISPPERFQGFHVGTDFEIMPEETDTEVKVFAICSGKVAFSGFAEGYGGLIAEHCTIDHSPVVVLYGHLLLSSLPSVDDDLIIGKQIAVLGPAKSHDTDGNRKHLHLGIHKGEEVVFLGYVQKEDDLTHFLDAETVLHRFAVMTP